MKYRVYWSEFTYSDFSTATAAKKAKKEGQLKIKKEKFKEV